MAVFHLYSSTETAFIKVIHALLDAGPKGYFFILIFLYFSAVVSFVNGIPLDFCDITVSCFLLIIIMLFSIPLECFF